MTPIRPLAATGLLSATLLAAFIGLASSVRADVAGVVFVDLDRDSVRDDAEPGRAGVAVSNGREVVRTDAAGHYRLPDLGPRGLVFATRPEGFDCERWYSRSGGDFALVPRVAAGGFFIHWSDSHVYDKPEEFIAEYELDGPWWAPRFLVAWLTMRALENAVVPRFTQDLHADLARARPGYRGADGKSAIATYLAYYDEFRRPGSKLGDVHAKIENAFGEIAALRPDFAVATGDLVLDANGSPRATLESWMRLYLRNLATVEQSGATVYNLIGNHELRGIRDPNPQDPEYGTGFFEATFGPSYYSFDRAGLHFIALDTHQPDPTPEEPGRYAYNRMRDEVHQWLQADLRVHAGERIVLMNHEPFFADATLPFEATQAAGHAVDADDLLREFGVSYTLNGHTHFPGFQRGDPTTHITAGSLTGFGWFLPPEVYPSGYRLFYARDGHLYAAWKQVGRALLGFVQPAGEPGIYPASAEPVYPLASAEPISEPISKPISKPMHIVTVAADVHGPFTSVSLELDGKPLPLERWGDYFFSATIGPAELAAAGGTLVLEATDAMSVVQSVQLPIGAER